MNLLVIDDDKIIAQYFKRLSTKIGGVKVVVAHTPDEIDRALRLDEFDCILCDIHLRNGDTGPEVLIGNKTLLDATTIHLISCADDMQKYADMLLSHGLKLGLCLRKPVDPKDFINFLKEYCK